MEQTSLETYVSGKIKSGEEPDAIKRNLLMAGWSESDTKEVLARALVANGVPSPSSGVTLSKGKTSSTVEVVLHFFSFIVLGIIATAFGILYYQIINAYFPDPLTLSYGSSYNPSLSAMHYAMAALFIGFPFYVFVVKMWFVGFLAQEDKTESKISKWLTYLVLLIAALALLGDLIASIFYLLEGEITTRFFLKALTIFVVAGGIFGFYFFERKAVQFKAPIPPQLFKTFLGVASALVAIGIVLGFVVGGSPVTERLRGLDQQRANDLSSISGCVSSFAREHKRLPGSFDEIAKSSDYAYCLNSTSDPVSGVPYVYTVTEASVQKGDVTEGTFELCATFDLSTEEKETLPKNSYMDIETKWSVHPAGYSCDTATVILESPMVTIPSKGVIEAMPVK